MTAAPALKIFRYELRDVVRSVWVGAYAVFFLVVTDALFRFGGGGSQVILSLMNLVLLLIPLVGLVFGTMYLYSARDFVELMLTQPVRRSELFAGLFGALFVPLAAGFALGTALPFLWHGAAADLRLLGLFVVTGTLLTACFLSLAFWITFTFEDRVRGLGAALLLWLVLAVVYDGFVLSVVYAFAAYPLEVPMIVLSILNPIDQARVLLLLQVDVAALLGYTGAAFERFFGTWLGVALSAAALTAWIVVPLTLAARAFARKDF